LNLDGLTRLHPSSVRSHAILLRSGGLDLESDGSGVWVVYGERFGELAVKRAFGGVY
jgi:hypothetical protein